MTRDDTFYELEMYLITALDLAKRLNLSSVVYMLNEVIGEAPVAFAETGD